MPAGALRHRRGADAAGARAGGAGARRDEPEPRRRLRGRAREAGRGRGLARPGGRPARRGRRPAAGRVAARAAPRSTSRWSRARTRAALRRARRSCATRGWRGSWRRCATPTRSWPVAACRCFAASGVAVETGLLAAEAARLNERFLAWARRGRPFVLLKAALTLDGRIATASGRSKWITSPSQRRQARWLRRLHDAVLVGVGTALADDPLLLPSPRTRRPFARVVLDSRLRLPARGRLARTATARAPVLVLSCAPEASRRRALEAVGVEVLEVAGEEGRVSLLRGARGAPRPRRHEPDGRGRRRGPRLLPGPAARRTRWPSSARRSSWAAGAAARPSAGPTPSTSGTPSASSRCRPSLPSRGPGRPSSSCGAPGDRLRPCSPASWKAQARFARRRAAGT